MMNIIKRAIRIVITGYIVKAIRNLISGKSNGENKYLSYVKKSVLNGLTFCFTIIF